MAPAGKYSWTIVHGNYAVGGAICLHLSNNTQFLWFSPLTVAHSSLISSAVLTWLVLHCYYTLHCSSLFPSTPPHPSKIAALSMGSGHPANIWFLCHTWPATPENISIEWVIASEFICVSLTDGPTDQSRDRMSTFWFVNKVVDNFVMYFIVRLVTINGYIIKLVKLAPVHGKCKNLQW